MPADPQAQKLDERRRFYHCDTLIFHDCEARGCPHEDYYPASVVDALREELAAAHDRYEALAIGRDEEQDQSTRLRAERDSLRAEVERLEKLNEGHRRLGLELLLGHAADLDRIASAPDYRDANARLKSSLLNERAEVARLAARVRELEAERDFYEERERYFAGLLKVSDLGRYRADWDGAVERVYSEGARQERERLRSWADEIKVGIPTNAAMDPREFGATWVLAELAAVLSEEGS